ncbi:hypothetical protein [Novilysobacter erysipheiresistens]|uniref:DUF4145 domain-containing protein n=1 Tax=Novilysobacter erysipheiresistens TaxID=1749332 RepID=A0ABU7YU97_9GAMM
MTDDRKRKTDDRCVRHDCRRALAESRAECEDLRHALATARTAVDFGHRFTEALSNEMKSEGVTLERDPVRVVNHHKARAERLAEALREIAHHGPNYGPDGARETWRHWSDIARTALNLEPTP